MRRIYALIGLFFPVPTGGGHWGVTLAIGDVPIGWVIVILAYLARYLP